MNDVLVVATSRKTHGGISSVIMAHERGSQWKEMNCHWVETHRSGNAMVKMFYLIKGFLSFLVRVPFCQLVHIHTSEPSSAIRKVPFLFIAKLFCKKIIVHFHAFDTASTICGDRQCVYRYLFNHADIVIALSPTWKKAINNVFALGDKVQVLYNPCPSIPQVNYELPKKKQILCAGVVNARKGYKDLIRAFSITIGRFDSSYSSEGCEWKLVFAGTGEIEDGMALAKELGIDNKVEFLGWVTGEKKDLVFRESSIFCLPSYAEGFPMAVLDAWSYGLPVLATPVGGLPDLVKNGEDCLLFNPGDYHRLAELLELMVKNEDLRIKIESASINFAKNVFNEKVINQQLSVIYEHLLHK